MKKSLFTFLTAILFTCGSSFLISCGEQSNETKVQDTEVHDQDLTNDDGSDDHIAHNYQCPMLCEGDKTYDKPGICPECKMDLEEINREEEHEHHDHDGEAHTH